MLSSLVGRKPDVEEGAADTYTSRPSMVVLDMGKYVFGVSRDTHPAAAQQDPGAGITTSGRQSSDADVLSASIVHDSSVLLQHVQVHAPVKVYSVLPSALAERARMWGSMLTLREGCRKTESSFFDAPGAVMARLAPLGMALDVTVPVTIVFASMAGARTLARLRPASAVSELLRLLHVVMVAALNAVPGGGYLCREQEGKMRTMLAFHCPADALQWCLVVQESLMYAPWPAALLALPELAEVRAPISGALLFRGPRLKIGLHNGVPRSITPDYLGRVDYHGSNVNYAARFTDAAAHGGQVVCEASLADTMFRWGPRRGAKGSLCGNPVSIKGMLPLEAAWNDGVGKAG